MSEPSSGLTGSLVGGQEATDTHGAATPRRHSEKMSPGGLTRNQTHRYLDLEPPASRTVTKSISVVGTPWALLLSYGGLSKWI